MDTITITKILLQDPFTSECFQGVLASNHLPATIKRLPACFVINTDPSWKAGSHWLALYFDKNGNAEFFDSYGKELKNYPFLYDFVHRHTFNCKQHNFQLQGSFSSTCGQFCIYFLLWRVRGITYEQILRSFHKSSDANDIIVVSFVNTFSKKCTKIVDVDYVINQICKSLS